MTAMLERFSRTIPPELSPARFRSRAFRAFLWAVILIVPGVMTCYTIVCAARQVQRGADLLSERAPTNFTPERERSWLFDTLAHPSNVGSLRALSAVPLFPRLGGRLAMGSIC